MKNVYLRNETYQFRIVINEKLYKYFKCKLYVKSMRTKNKTVAAKFAKILRKKYEYILQSAEMNVSEEVIKDLVYEFTHTQLEDTEKDLYNTANIINSTFYLMLEDILTGYQNAYNTSDYNVVKKDIQKISKSLSAELDNEDIEIMSKMLIESHITNLKLIKKRIENNDYSKSIKIKTVTKKPIKNNLKTVLQEYITNNEISQKWSSDTKNSVKMIQTILVMYFNDVDVNEITKKDLLELRNTLFKIPKKFTQMRRFKDKTLDYILSNSDDLEKISANTINKYLLRINHFFKYCKEMQYINDDLHLDKVKEEHIQKTRDEYSKEDLQKVFKHLSDIDDEDSLVIKIALHAGMRLNEILQLTVADIKIEDDIYYFDINNKNNKQIKNKSSIRKVPIHSKIIDEVLEFIKNKSNNLFTKTSKQYSKFYRINFNRKYITDDTTKVFHSFRHNFVNALIQRDVKGEHIAQLVGHSQELHMTMSVYGNAINLKLLKDTIENLRY